MIRKNLEIELIEIRYEFFTAAISQKIHSIVAEQGCSHTDDVVLDLLWDYHRFDLISIVFEEFDGIDCEELRKKGSIIPNSGRETIRKYIENALSYETELGDYSDDEFESIYRNIRSPIVRAARRRRDEASKEQDRWAFFSKPEAEPAYERWQNLLLSPAQAVALSFGKDPDVVNPTSLEPYRRVLRSPFREAYRERLERVKLAVAEGELPRQFKIEDFAAWSLKNQISLPGELIGTSPHPDLGADQNLRMQLLAAKAEIEDLKKELAIDSTARKRTMYRIILGIAVMKFGFKPGIRNSAAKNISKSCESAGINVSDDKVYDYLNEAVRDLGFQLGDTDGRRGKAKGD
jgi:hypothetical protein